jgi:hypothetical protein
MYQCMYSARLRAQKCSGIIPFSLLVETLRSWELFLQGEQKFVSFPDYIISTVLVAVCMKFVE